MQGQGVGRRRDGRPVWVGKEERVLLDRAELRSSRNGSDYDEAWLQKLIFENPEVLPIEQLESGIGRIFPVCRELTLAFGAGKSGSLDNFFMTDRGHLVLVEAKLWRNPDARRLVVAQAIEYAAAVFRLSYEELEKAALTARKNEDAKARSLFELASAFGSQIDEAEFIDAVSRNLSRGRAIIAVVGDGIREDLAPLAALLQSHAGHRFTFGLIELAIFETPQTGIRIVIPSILAQTTLIERGVVQIQDDLRGGGKIVITDVANSSSGVRDRSFSMSEDEFFEVLETRSPGSSTLLKPFLSEVKNLGVYVDLQRGLNLKHRRPSASDNDLNLAVIDRGGIVDTGPSSWFGRQEIGRKYSDALANAIGGIVRESGGGGAFGLRTQAGKMPRITDLLPTHREAWLAAMEQYIRSAFEEAKEPY